jgi:DNA-binding CsgD family transcriptional regulator
MAGKKLTPSELLIVRHVYGGYVDKEIAQVLKSHIRTIQQHKLRARKKLGARTKRDLFLICRERGIQAV